MITKFKSIGEEATVLEIEKTDSNTVTFEIEHLDPYTTQEPHVVEISKDDLFSLLGQLLRIQSEIRKESINE